MVPPGADTIVIQENTTERDGERVTVTSPSLAGKHIRRAGLDFKNGAGAAARAAAVLSRSRRDARRRHEPSDGAGASAAQGRRARDRR